MKNIFQSHRIRFLFIFLFALILSACDHGPGDPASMVVTKNFVPPKTLSGQKLYITFADSKGLFAKRSLDDYFYQFTDNSNFQFYQTAENKPLTSGTYKYRINLKKPRVARLIIRNKTGIFSNKTFLMQLNYYNVFMGTYKVWLLGQSKTNYATGIFKL